MKEIHVAGKQLPLDPSIFDGKHGTVLDSGTTYAYLPEAAFMAFKKAIMKELQSLKQIHGADPNFNDICFSGAPSDVSQLSQIFPVVEMVLENGQKLSLSAENYMFRHAKVDGAYCLGIFQNGKDPTTLLGGIIVRNTLVMYDREHSKVGFWKTNCSQLWEMLRITDASAQLPPAPTPTENDAYLGESNSTIESSSKILPEVYIGQITFEMLLRMNYSDLKPQLADLAMFIAKELDIDASQVHFLNLTLVGSNSLMKWAIFPPESATYISNVTAIGIISQLAEHRMQLPEKFGPYQLVKWKIEPPSKRTWWKQHYSVVVLAIVVTIIVGLSAFGIWFILRHRQQTVNSYKPVDADVAEQELQPI